MKVFFNLRSAVSSGSNFGRILCETKSDAIYGP